jgi:hypothetical protein
MITIADIIKWSKPHQYSGGEGRMTRFGDGRVTFSIVGGARGLYGDFVNDFEMAIFDKESKQFITKFFYPEATDDVIPYMDANKVEELVNSVIKREDLSIER